MEQRPILELKGITKSFGATRALHNVSLELRRGEIHAILGQNGAGKSTLVKILACVHKEFEGDVYYDGHRINENGLQSLARNQIGFVHQEFPLVPDLSVAENIYLGRFPKLKVTGRIKWRELFRNAKDLLTSLNIAINPRARVADLTMGERQLLAIARALSTDPQILVFDEATSTLTNREVETIFDILLALVKKGVSVIYISHRMDEIFRIAHRVTVLRDGASISTVTVEQTDRSELIRMMVGREIQERFPVRDHRLGQDIMSIRGFSDGKNFNDCTFSVRRGEIVGIAGLVGAGHPELMRAIFGARDKTMGHLYIDGEQVVIANPRDAIKNKVYYVTSDRVKEGLLRDRPIHENITLPFLKRFCRVRKIISHRMEKEISSKYIKRLQIRCSGPGQNIGELSGGNQQKVIIARWLCGNGRIFLFDEPTRGLDVGVRYDVYTLMNEIVENGGSIIMISSELPEILGMSDRVIVMREGRIVREFNNEGLGQEKVLADMMGQ